MLFCLPVAISIGLVYPATPCYWTPNFFLIPIPLSEGWWGGWHCWAPSLPLPISSSILHSFPPFFNRASLCSDPCFMLPLSTMVLHPSLPSNFSNTLSHKLKQNLLPDPPTIPITPPSFPIPCYQIPSLRAPAYSFYLFHSSLPTLPTIQLSPSATIPLSTAPWVCQASVSGLLTRISFCPFRSVIP